jgi:hypothetical protein
MLVLMDDNYDPVEIYEAEREDLLEAVEKAGSSRSKRGAVSVAKFKIIAQRVWSQDSGVEDDGIWDNQAGA